MRIAIPVWGVEISPAFDFSKQVLIVESHQGREVLRRGYPLPRTPLSARAERLRELGVDLLLCGGISGTLQKMVAGFGIGLIAWKCGPVEEVLKAYFSASLDDPRYTMPGTRDGVPPPAETRFPPARETTGRGGPPMKRKILPVLLLVLAGVFSARCAGEAMDPGVVDTESRSPQEWIEMLTDEDLCKRTAALLALERLGSEAVPEILKAMEGSDPRSRHGMVAVLHLMGPEAGAALPPLLNQVRDVGQPECSRLLILRTLERMGPEARGAAPVLAGLIQDKREPECVRVQAARVLLEIGAGSGEVLPMLLERMSDPEGCTCVRVLCTKMLRRMGPECRCAAPALATLAMDRCEKKGLRISALKTLASMGPVAKEAVPALIGMIQDPGETRCMRILAAKALGRIGPEAQAAVPALRQASPGDDLLFRRAVQNALQRIEVPSEDRHA